MYGFIIRTHPHPLSVGKHVLDVQIHLLSLCWEDDAVKFATRVSRWLVLHRGRSFSDHLLKKQLDGFRRINKLLKVLVDIRQVIAALLVLGNQFLLALLQL